MKESISIIIIVPIILVFGLIGWGFAKSYKNSNTGNVIATKIDCKFIRLVHANHNLGYFECGDSIIIKRVN